MAKYEFLKTFIINAVICTLICVFVITTYYYKGTTTTNNENSNKELEQYPYRQYKGDYGVTTTPATKYSEDVNYVVECKSSDSGVNYDDHYVKVNTNYGIVRGLKKSEFGVKINEFLGIPYAKPPVGNLRFEKPVKLNSWTGIKDAIEWPQVCPQAIPKIFNSILNIGGKLFDLMSKNKTWSDDCLRLNVWSPQVNNSLLPVLAVIHGGGFVNFGISINGIYGGVLAALGNVVVVSFQYRLGFLGYLKYADQTDSVIGNMGFYDQIMALEWIKDNIRLFGGNPNEVTLSGQSAGGISTGLLMSSPLSRHLFKRAIIQSGTPNMIPQSISQRFEKLYDSFINHTSCANARQKIKCLKKLETSEIVSVQDKLFDLMPIYMPSVPHQLFPQHARHAFSVDEADDDLYQKQVLLGINKHEATLFMHLVKPDIFTLNANSTPHLTLENLRDFLINDPQVKSKKLPFGVNQTVSMLASIIRVDIESNEDITEKVAHLITDFVYTCGTLSMAESLQQWNNTKVYLYYLTSIASHPNWPKWMSVPHIEDLQFVFGIPLRYPQSYSGQDIDFTKRIIAIWTQFATNGKMLPQLSIDWPQYTENNPKHMELNANYATIGSKLNESYCSMYETVVAFFE